MINKKELNFLNMETPKDNKPTKEDLQIKKLQLQIEALEEKKKAQQQKQQQQINKTDISKTISILIYLFLAPFLIIGFFAIECAKASAGSGRRRR
jgi:membrane protein insertase Oxa1/YidC/SpoIIIJ